jgi:hypothetical protein
VATKKHSAGNKVTPVKAVVAPKPSGLASVDDLLGLAVPTLQNYIDASSDYIDAASSLTDGQKKAAQIRLSNCLGRVMLVDLRNAIGGVDPLPDAQAGEVEVGGGLRSAQSDVTDMHRTDGIRLAVELKPVHLAVGRAIWNRFGDVRVFAVNIHLKFPFAVVAGVMTIPLEERKTSGNDVDWKSTAHLIDTLVARLSRAARRDQESDPAHLLESATAIVFDHRTRTLDPDRPPVGSGLRWDECITALALTYKLRFE